MKIILTKGLPASGKSTWAREFIKGKKDWVRVNNDELGSMLFGETFAEGRGHQIDSFRHDLINKALDKDLNVIIDNTNLHPKHEEYVKELVTTTYTKYTVEIKDFTHVPLNECIKRNKARANPVPEKVIRGMYTQYVLPNTNKPTQDTTLPKAVVFDIDGTIARMVGRSPYDDTKYYTDEPIPEMIELLKMYRANGHYTIFLTGRHEKGRAITIKWLKDKCGIEPGTYMLLMRDDGDKSPDFEYKELIFRANVSGKYYVPIWFEDRIRNVEMARTKLGINALQIGDGDF